MLINFLEKCPTIHPYMDSDALMVMASTGIYKIGGESVLPFTSEGNVKVTRLPMSDGNYHSVLPHGPMRMQIVSGLVVVTLNGVSIIQVDMLGRSALKSTERTIWDALRQDSDCF
jgi:hypothetical protein